MRRSIFVSILFGISLIHATTGYATIFAPVDGDSFLLSADAIVVATIAGFEFQDNNVVRVQLEHVEVLAGQDRITSERFVGGDPYVDVELSEVDALAVRQLALPKFRSSNRSEASSLTATGIRSLDTPEGMPDIDIGAQYLMFISGGVWQVTPFLSQRGLYRVGSDQIIECDGGQVYGYTSAGMVCSTPERQASPPPPLEEFVEILRNRVDFANRARPNEALERRESAQPISVSPLIAPRSDESVVERDLDAGN